MKRLISLLLAVIMMASLMVACAPKESGTAASNDANGGKPITIKVGHAAAETNSVHTAWLNFKKLVEEKSEGKITVNVFGNAQLGSDRELTEAVQIGNIEMASGSSAPVAAFKKEFYVLDMPFLFKDRETVYKTLDGEVGQELLGSLSEVGIKGIAFWENGFRNLTNSKVAVRKPEDLNGLKIRTMENDVHIAAWKLLGANPTPMAFGELFTALQQKTVDGQENPSELIYDTKIHEVQKYLTQTQHIYSPYVVMMNKDFYNKLSPEYQKIIDDSIKETTDMQRKIAAEKEKKAEDAMKATLEFIELTVEEKAAFRDKMTPAYELVKQKAGEQITNKILEATK